ncbi:MAG: response regulator transcription factor [Verrucomicrobia bacterium]|nr:response regulator transcription factor [Verrucomicrobiota bacterium]
MSSIESRVFVLDDDRSVRLSLATLLESDGLTVETFASAVEYLARAPHGGPACLVLDVMLPGLSGLALQHKLVERGRMEQVVFLTGHGNVSMSVQAMKEGAVDFLEKPFSDEELLLAVRHALSRSKATWTRRNDIARVRSRIATLTPREFEVFRLVIAGWLNKQIAAELGAALRTIKTHRGRVMRKLGVESVADLVRLAQRAEVNPDVPVV